MGVLDLRPQACFNYATCHFYREQQREFLELGCEKSIYLSFALPIWLSDCIFEAQLILYKAPFCAPNTDTTACTMDEYNLYPLTEIFNVYGCRQRPPAVSIENSVCFQNCASCDYTAIDITQVVKLWSNNTIINNGVLLIGEDHAATVSYASDHHVLSEMSPILRLIFTKTDPIGAMQSVACDVEVTRPLQ